MLQAVHTVILVTAMIHEPTEDNSCVYLKPEHYDKWYNNFQPWYPCINDPYPYRNCELANHFTGNVPELETANAGWHRRFGVAVQRCVWRLAVASRGESWLSGGESWLSGGGGGLRQSFRRCGHVSIWRPTLSGIAMFMCSMWCVMSVWRALCAMCDAVCLMMLVCFVMLCAWKASVYLSKRINSSLLTKIFNGIGWEGCVTQRQS